MAVGRAGRRMGGRHAATRAGVVPPFWLRVGFATLQSRHPRPCCSAIWALGGFEGIFFGQGGEGGREGQNCGPRETPRNEGARSDTHHEYMN